VVNRGRYGIECLFFQLKKINHAGLLKKDAN
jgi:hypothetical protein